MALTEEVALLLLQQEDPDFRVFCLPIPADLDLMFYRFLTVPTGFAQRFYRMLMLQTLDCYAAFTQNILVCSSVYESLKDEAEQKDGRSFCFLKQF